MAASTWAIRCIFIIISVLVTSLNVVVIALPEWLTGDTFKLGLFKYCGIRGCVSYQSNSVAIYREHGIYFTLTASALSVGLLLNVCSLILTFVFVFIPQRKRRPRIMSAAMGLSFAAGIMSATAIAIWIMMFIYVAKVSEYNSKSSSQLGAAFYLTIIFPFIFSFVHAFICPVIKRRGMRRNTSYGVRLENETEVVPQASEDVARSLQIMPQNLQIVPQSSQDIPQTLQAVPQNQQVVPQSNQQIFFMYPSGSQQSDINQSDGATGMTPAYPFIMVQNPENTHY